MLRISCLTILLYSCSNHLSTVGANACGRDLSEQQILLAAERYLRVSSPNVRIADLSPVIRRDDECNYVVVFHYGGLKAVEDTVIVVDRRGRVRNLPECCVLGDCPEFCATKK